MNAPVEHETLATTNDQLGVASLTVPAGLASGSTITATYSGSPSGQGLLAASFTGLDVSAVGG